MYNPSAFTVTDPARLHAFIDQNGFATLVSSGRERFVASHLPLLLDRAAGPQGQLLGHMARANPQWRDVEGEVLAIFQGPHTYISPSWYEEDGTVPTWNYVAVHAYGTFQVIDERAPLIDLLHRLVDQYESPRARPWLFDDSAGHVEKMLQAIVGFRIEITRLEGKWKLSQNHSRERQERVVRALQGQQDDDSRSIADLMEARLRKMQDGVGGNHGLQRSSGRAHPQAGRAQERL